jgi:hypothetical protein
MSILRLRLQETQSKRRPDNRGRAKATNAFDLRGGGQRSIIKARNLIREDRRATEGENYASAGKISDASRRLAKQAAEERSEPQIGEASRN